MRTWFWTLFLATIAVVLAVTLRENTGNVLILVNTWRIQVSLAFAVLVLVGSFLALYILLRTMAWFTSIPMRLRSWHEKRQSRRDHDLLEQGWTELLEGRYAHAEKDLTKLLGRTGSVNRQVLAALSAARAAHALGEFERRDGLLTQAREKATEDDDGHLKDAVATAAADLYLDQGLAQQALDVLLPLQQSGARHVHTLRLLLRAYRQLNHHDQVFVLARTLSRRGALNDTEAKQMIEHAAAARLRDTLHSGQWREIWKDLKSEERILPEVALAGAAAFDAGGQAEDASRTLELAISARLDPRLLAAYSRCESSQVARRLEKAEGWLTRHPENPDLLTTLGNLCLAGQIWGQAEHYLKRSVDRRTDARVHALLGSLYDKLGRQVDAAAQWRLATAVGTAIPVLAEDAYLPAADTASDPGVLHAEGLAYFAETGFPAEQVTERSESPASGQTNATVAKPYVAAASHELEEYFDSAPIPGIGDASSTESVKTSSELPASGLRSAKDQQV
ncbi:MAG TPA: protoheme IX synthesis protein [Alcaligenaceae bacterium]|nr:protoheme IX synthesis protein [Alcaligenaceae bacterium]